MMSCKKIIIGTLAYFFIAGSFSTIYADTITDSSVSSISNSSEGNVDNWMPDHGVQAIVTKSLGLSNPSEITKSAMLKLNSFEADGTNFNSFEGLQYASNLKTFSVRNSQLPNDFKVSFLATNMPKITSLTLSNCGLYISNFDGYISFPNIESLDISSNHIIAELDLVEILASPANIDASDATIKLESSWTPKKSFISATNIDGSSIDYNDLSVESNVNTEVPGNYSVEYTYSLNNNYKNIIYKKINVTVLPSETSLIAKDSQLPVGPKTSWSAVDNFVNATDQDGQAVDFKDVKVSGTVDTTKAGAYKITYSYTDVNGNEVSKTITVTVVSNSDGNNNNDQSSHQSSLSQKSINDKHNGTPKTMIKHTVDAVLPNTGSEKVTVSEIIAVVALSIVVGLVFVARRIRK